MAKFQLNSGALPQVSGSRPQRVRIGSISVFALVVIISLAVLAILALSTANASLVMSQRQAQAMTELYLDERAAQEFVAGTDALLAEARANGSADDAGQEGIRAVQGALDKLCANARSTASGKVRATAAVDGQQITAEFACDNGRLLNIVLVVRDNGTYRVDKWKMTAVQNEEPPEGQLLIVD